MKYISSINAIVLISACSSGDGRSSTESYSDLRTTYLSIDNEISADSVVDPSTLPTSGSANYDGTLFIETPANVDILGKLEMAFDFDNDSFNGKATDFVDDDNDTYDGQLDITNGDINRAANTAVTVTFFGDVDGTITDPDDNFYTIDAQVVGNFYGDDEQYIAGGVRGTAASNLGDFTLEDANTGIRGEK
jgi:hypothetical protein